MPNAYYQILEVTEHSSADEIRRAYRRKAKLYHPDYNKSADAHEQFVLLNEAYHYVLSVKSAPRTAQAQTSQAYTEADYRAYRREQARRYAEMAFENYKKTPEYRNAQAAATLGNYFHFFFSVLLLSCPLFGFLWKGLEGLFVTTVFTAISAPVWIGIFRNPKKLGWSRFRDASLVLIETNQFKYGFTALVNVLVFLNNTLYTDIDAYWLILIIGLLYLGTYTAVKKRRSWFSFISGRDLYLCLVPTIFNLFFFLNYVGSYNPKIETYEIVDEKQLYGLGSRNLERIATIKLEGNAYADQFWFTTFSFEAMQQPGKINYEFKTGLFGLRVVKSHSFIYD